MLPDYCKKCKCYDEEDNDCGAALEYPEGGRKCVIYKCHYCYYYQKIGKRHKCILNRISCYFKGNYYYLDINKKYPALCKKYIEICDMCKYYVKIRDKHDNTIYTDCIFGTGSVCDDCKYEPIEVKDKEQILNGTNP